MRLTKPIAHALAATLVVATFSACSGTEKPEALLAKAQASIAANDAKAAEIHLKNLLLQDEQNAEARFLLAGLYLAAGDLGSADKEYRRARDLGFDRDKVMPPLLETLFRMNRYQDVVSEARGIALGDPAAQARALGTMGRAQVRLGQMAEAGRSFAAALAARPDDVAAQVGATSVRALNDRPAARVAVDAILQRHPQAPEALILKGDIEAADGNAGAARALYEKAADLAPRDLETRAKIVSLALELNDTAGARARFDELRKLAPAAPGTHYLRAMIEVREGKLASARDAAQEALRLAPEYMPAVSLAAGLNLSLNALEQAERYARMMVERTPDNPLGYRVLGAAYLRMNSPDRALAAVRPVLDRTPPDPVVLSIAGEAALKMNQPDTAARYFERAAKIDPSNARSKTGLALSHLARGESERGIGELEQAVQLDSANIQADVALVMARVRERQYDKALEAVSRMEKKAPQSPVPAGLRGSVLAAKGDTKGARAAFEKALQVDPTFFPAAANLANFDLRDNRPGDARQRYEAILAKDPKHAQAAVALSTLIAQTGGSREQVLDALKKAREANPDAVLPILATARYLIETNTPKDAIPMLQEASNRNPENTEVLDLLATAFARSDQRAQAIGTWEKLLRVNPKAAVAQFRIGDTQLAGGEVDAALASFRKAAQIAPDAVEPQVGIARALYRQGKKDEALRVAAQMRAGDKLKIAGAVLEGDLLGADGKWSEAADSYRAAFTQQRALPTGHKLLNALRAAKRDDDADRVLRDWVRAEPGNLPLRMYAGDAETVRQRWKPAFEHYAVVLEKEPRNALALNNAAWALHELKDPRAVELARRAYEAVPKSPSVLDTYGVILNAKGDPKGLEMMRQAIELAPENPQLRLHLAEALAGAGDKAGAKTQIDALLKAAPEGRHAAAAKALRDRL